MKVSAEWRGHAHDLRRICEALKKRPTCDADSQIDELDMMADDLEKEADEYATMEKP